MYKEKILILVLSGFGAGIAIRSFFELGWPYAVLAAVLSAFGFILWKTRSKEWFLASAIFVLTFGFGILRYDITDQKNVSENLQTLIGQQATIHGAVFDEPDERENSTRYIVAAKESFDWNIKEWREARGDKILVFAPRYPGFKYGDALEARGKLQKPENFTNEFSWENYLAKDDIFLQMLYPDIEKISEGGGHPVKRTLFAVKNKYLESLGRVLPEPHAALVGGLTVGAKGAMPKDLLEDFRKTGVIHIVVLSGYNITIIARAVAAFFSFFMPWLAGVLSGIVGIILFAILAGGSATVVRASIMAILIYFARMTGNVYRASIALFVAGFFMIIHNPKLLRFDASFQLSFLATMGLIYLSPKIEKYLKFVPRKFNLREVVSATISAQIAVTPFILHNMGTFSLVALPTNILILATVPAAMLFGAIAGIAGWISVILSIPAAWTAYALIEYELKVVNFFANTAIAEINFDSFSLYATILLYCIILWFAFMPKPFLNNIFSTILNRWRTRGWKIEEE